jgi:TolB-like protein
MKILDELKRRNVFRVAIAYMVISWVVLQVSDLILENIEAPAWVMKFMILLMLIGLLISIIISWAYELTPDGLKRDADVNHETSSNQVTIKKLDILILIALSIIAIMFAWDKFYPEQASNERLNITQINSELKPITNDLKQSLSDTESDPVKNLRDNSIAVLPFAHRSELKNDLYFTDGIHDDLLTQLAKIQKLNVTSRTSVMQYRDTDKSIKEIAGELNVNTILEGGIQRAGTRIRINAQLIDVATDEHLWAETFDREMTLDNLFDIQSEITKQIVTAIKGQLTTEDEKALVDAPTQSIEAYEAYQKANETMFKSDYSYESFKKIEEYLKLSLHLDPQFALAHLMLADNYGGAFWFGYDLVEDHQQAVKDSIKKAESLLPKYSPELIAAQGEYYYRFENNYGAALNSLLKAHMAMPSDSELLAKIGYTQRRLGLWEDAVDSLMLSHQLDPNNVGALQNAAETLVMLKQWDRLEKLLTSSLDKFSNNWSLNEYAANLPFMKSGNLVEYRKLVDNLPQSTSKLNKYYSEIGVLIYERNFPKLLEILHSPEIQDDKSTPNDGDKLLLGYVYKFLDEKEKSINVFKNLISHLTIRKQKTLSSLQKNRLYRILIFALLELGEEDQALQEMEIITREITIEKDHSIGVNLLQMKAQVLARVGRRDEALELIEEIIDQPNSFIRWDLQLSPFWDFFRDDERFNELIKPKNFDESIHANKSRAIL